MTVLEFSQEMDIIYENINKGGAVGLDEYEKSVILTQAQDELVMSLATADTVAISKLVKTVVLDESDKDTESVVIDKRSKVFTHGHEIMYLLSEGIAAFTTVEGVITVDLQMGIVPLLHAAYMELVKKPYTLPPRKVAYRLINSSALQEVISEAANDVTTFEVLTNDASLNYKYYMTYVMYPEPIILAALTDGSTIKGQTAEATSKLAKTLHTSILQYATTLAEQYYLDKQPPQQQAEPEQ